MTTRLFRSATLATLFAAVTLSSTVSAAESSYDGSFAEIQSSGGVCDQVFATADYHTRHFITGPTRRTSVLHFGNASDEPAFFDGVSFVGLLGGTNDLYYEKTITVGDVDYQILAEGLIDYEVVYLEFTVEAKDAAGTVLCDAKATYSGFN